MKKNIIAILFVIILSFGTFVPLFSQGFFTFHDNTQVERVHQMGKMLSQLTFPVRWVPDLGYGFGYPIFNFYGPLPYYVGGLATLIGFNALISTKFMIAIAMIISSVTMFLLVKRFFGYPGAILGAVVYSYFPYHAVNLYVRGAINELFAYAFLPLVLLGVLMNLHSKKINAAAVLIQALGIFFVAISHNLSFLMLMIILSTFFSVSIFYTTSKLTYLISFALAFFLGTAMASFYIFPAFFEMGYTNVSSQIGGGANFRDHFVCISQFWNSTWGYGGSVRGCVDGMSFILGKINLILIIGALTVFIYSLFKKSDKFEKKLFFLGFLSIIISIFFAIEISVFIWKLVPFMDYIQYPWRFINFIALFASFILGFIPFILGKLLNKKISVIISIFAVGLIIIFNQKFFNPQSLLNIKSDYYTDQVHLNFVTSKISDEYLPKDFDKPQSMEQLTKEIAYFKSGDGILEIDKKRHDYYIIKYQTFRDSIIQINRAYFPSWKARINNEQAAINKNKNGFSILVPQGSGSIEIGNGSTILQMLSNYVSLISILSFCIIVIILIRNKSIYGKKVA